MAVVWTDAQVAPRLLDTLSQILSPALANVVLYSPCSIAAGQPLHFMAYHKWWYATQLYT